MDDPKQAAQLDDLVKAGFRATLKYFGSQIKVPLFTREGIFGSLTLLFKGARNFSPEDVALAMSYGDQASLAIENARLYQAEQQRRHEAERRREAAEQLRQMLEIINSSRPLGEVLDGIVQQAAKLLKADATMIRRIHHEGNQVTTEAQFNLPDEFEAIRAMPYYQTPRGDLLQHHRAIVVTDLEKTFAAYIHNPQEHPPEQVHWANLILRHYQSYLVAPLFIRDQLFGTLTYYYRDRCSFDDEECSLAVSLADQAALAIENARLYQQEQERRIEAEKRRQVAEGLREMLTVLNSQRPLDVVLESIVGLAEILLSAQAVAIFRLHPEKPVLEIHSARGLSAEYIRIVNVPVGKGAAGRAVQSGKPVLVEDAATFLQEVALDDDGQARRRVLQEASGRFKSLLAVPMTVGDTPYGAISLYYNHHRQFQKEEVDLAVSFADQAALAIETARLREQAGLAAAAAERNRLARDLHDAVTQTLFSASLIAEVLPRLLENKPDEAAVRLEELRQLTRGALAEMRTLLLELRPSSLTEVNLGDLLRQLCEAFTGRARVPVRLSVEGEVRLPADVQVALYRIAQEALNNIAKHAGAKQVRLQLRCLPAEVELQIEDDGSGFDQDKIGAGHFGLKIMAERAEAVGAAFYVQSTPGEGTKIKVSWRVVEGEGKRNE